MAAIRGGHIAMIFQDPMMTLNPVLKISTQMIEAVRAHVDISKQAARERGPRRWPASASPRPTNGSTPTRTSSPGGMRQRVAIAIALLHDPEVIVADEPTTALDVTIQAQILAEVQKLAEGSGTALIWITHDLSVVSSLADNIAVMYAGRVVEQGRAATVLEHPAHPYTYGLIESIPSRNKRGVDLAQIPGMTPPLLLPDLPRCPNAAAACPFALHPSALPKRPFCLDRRFPGAEAWSRRR
jgi:peptide/nickel transport system ATP-binding protein